MRVVIDTSVLVSAIIKDKDPERVVMFAVQREDIDWVVSQDILVEYREVLSRPKFGLPPDLLSRWFDLLEAVTVQVEVPIGIDFPRDPADAKFIACALAADAEFLITSDRDFTEARRLLRTTIVSVSMFNRLMCAA